MTIKTRNKIVYQDNQITKFLIESPKYGNREVIIDAEDYDKIKQYNWLVAYSKQKNIFYIISHTWKNGKRTTERLSRIILNLTNPKIKGDHINHNTFDCRKQNLRECTNQQNCCNRKLSKNNTSGFKGVSWNKQMKKWQARIWKNRKVIYLGFFLNKERAAEAYNMGAIKHFGEFANLNEI